MMGLLGDKKKIASVILSEVHAPKRPEEKNVPQGIEADFSAAHEALASDIISGIKDGDPGMVSRSLKQFFQLCEKEGDYTEEGE